MKTEELKNKGLTQDQIDFVMAENGKDLKQLQEDNKTLTEDRDGWKKKAETAEGERDTLKGQLETANNTLEKFKDIDPDKIAGEIETYKQEAANAKANADKQILQRDQRDYLNAEFDKLGITSERTRKSLMAEIMGEDGLKWKNGSFLGLSDFLAKENEKDHFYQTQEEKDEAAAKEKATGSAPKFTEKSNSKKNPEPEVKTVPKIW